MTLREKIKRFWTLDVHNHEGFTLVELIIVIAILAILSSVAVVGYSSYIKKANMAADRTLTAEIVQAMQLANYESALTDVVTIVLQKDKAVEITGDSDAAEAWVLAALQAAYGENYASLLKIKYEGWGNGITVTNAMLTALRDGGDIEAAMDLIYGNADNLSFTEEIPTLMDEVRDVAEELSKDKNGEISDEVAIGLVSSAAGVTAKWDVSKIQALWNRPISYDSTAKKYVFSGEDQYIPAETKPNDAKLTIAGVVRAKNTCIALYISQNGYPQYYSQLSSFSVSDTSLLPLDLMTAGTNQAVAARLCDVLDLDPVNDKTTIDELTGLVGDYFSASSNGNLVYKNDAAAYAAMMGIVDGLATDEDSPLSSNNLDEYFNAVSGPVSLFQQMVMGTADIEKLTASLNSISVDGSNISITLIPNGLDLVIIVGPTTVLE